MLKQLPLPFSKLEGLMESWVAVLNDPTLYNSIQKCNVPYLFDKKKSRLFSKTKVFWTGKSQRTIFNRKKLINEAIEDLFQLDIKDIYEGFSDHLKHANKIICDRSVTPKFRQKEIFLRIGSKRYVNTLCASDIEKAVKQLSTELPNLIFCPVSAFIAMPMLSITLCCIHPFNDGNGRLSRVFGNVLFQKHFFDEFKSNLLSTEEIEDTFGNHWHQEIIKSCQSGNAKSAILKWISYYQAVSTVTKENKSWN